MDASPDARRLRCVHSGTTYGFVSGRFVAGSPTVRRGQRGTPDIRRAADPSATGLQVLDHLAVVGQAARRDAARPRRAAWSRRGSSRRCARQALGPRRRPRPASVMRSFAISPSTTSRARCTSGWRRAISATWLGCTNMPRTLVVWSARPSQPRMRVLVRPVGQRARQHRRQVAGAEADQRVVGVQRGHDHLADLAVGHRVAGAGAHDLDDHAFVEHAGLRAPRSRRRSGRGRRCA